MRWHPTTTRIAVILTLAFVVAAVVWLNRSPVPSQIEPAQIELAFVEGPLEDPGKLGLVSSLRLSSTGQIEVLVIYTQFADETDQGEDLPEHATDLFNPNLAGSFTHYYTTMSFDQLQINGTVLPKRYTSDQPASAYLSRTPVQKGNYAQFTREILTKVDADYDLGRFDNDGPDGLANSGDDDGRVDYVFVLMRSVPANFLLGNATGIAGIGQLYSSADPRPNNRTIAVLGKRYYGAIMREASFTYTVGVMAHEFGHSLGLPDLYDLSFQDAPKQNPAEDGAGIGKWGLMGRGALGWTNSSPSPMSAWSREQLGWIGPDNTQLVELQDYVPELFLDDLNQQGSIYKIPFDSSDDEGSQEYLLLEHRSRDAHFYNRDLPAEGMLVWHVRPWAMDNKDERFKLLDLVCADGLYRDAGYPQGNEAVIHGGGDNLDFWANNTAYRTAHAGNLGDATDLFDGEHFTRLAFHPTAVNEPDLILTMQRQGNALLARFPLVRGRFAALAQADVPTLVEFEETTTAHAITLHPNHPNPFNSSTTIAYVLAESAAVRLSIYNALGQIVRQLVDDIRSAGEHNVMWDGRDDNNRAVASGVYFYRLIVGAQQPRIRQMALLR
jgi:M6 family metalloprotease-like protein